MKTKILIAIIVLVQCPLFGQVLFSDLTSYAGLKGDSNSPYSINLAWGDYDNDGYLDVYVTNWGSAVSSARNILYRNNGNVTFSDVSSETGTGSLLNSTSAVWGDYDNDGDLDLYVTNYYNQDILYKNLLIESGEAKFENYTSTAGLNVVALGNEMAAAWVDYNNDSYLDIYICKYYAKNELYRNNGNGTFTAVTDDAGIGDFRDSEGAVWTDYNDDGYADLYVINREQENTFYENEGNGTFTEKGGILGIDNIELGRNATFFDYNGNGYQDLFICNIGANSFYSHDVTSFSDISAAAGIKQTGTGWDSWDQVTGDFDMDGDWDIIVVGGGDAGYQANAYFENQGGTFADVTETVGLSRGPFSGHSYSTAVSAADFDGDGDLDVYVVNYADNIFYYNQVNPANYIKVTVQGKGTGGSNKSGIGSRIKLLEGGTLVEFYEIRSSSGPHEVIFGGIDPAKTYTLEVAMPGVSFHSTPSNVISRSIDSIPAVISIVEP